MIPQEKIKTMDYLFNRIISERIRDSFEPKYCLLLGAGCSISSSIPSASGVIIAIQEISKEYQQQKTSRRSVMDGSTKKPPQFLGEAETMT